MADKSKPFQQVSFELAGIFINGEPPPGKADQRAVLVLKEERVTPKGDVWTQHAADNFKYIPVLLVTKGSAQLVSRFLLYLRLILTMERRGWISVS